MNKFALAAAVLGSVLLVGCAGNEAKPELEDCHYPDAPNAEAPRWICDQPIDDIELQAVGSAPKSAAGHHFMKQRAEARARVALAQQLKVQISNMFKDYVEATGASDQETVDQVATSVTKQITDQTLIGARTYRTRTSPSGMLYVLMGMSAESMEQATDTAIRTSMNNERAAWQQFRAKKGFDELRKELREFRQAQGQ